jgi:hypothetical protein
MAKAALNDWRAIARLAKGLTPETAARLYKVFKQFGEKIDLSALEASVRNGLVDRVLVEAPAKLINPNLPVDMLRRGAIVGGDVAAKSLGAALNLNLRFDVTNPLATERAAAQAAALVTNITETTRQTINQVITRAFQEQYTTEDAADLLRPILPLLPKHADAVMNYHSKLEADGMDPNRALALAVAYADRLVKYRALMIARHEILSASNAGQSALWDQAVDAGYIGTDTKRIWIITPDDRLCPLCAQMVGARAITGLNEPWDTPVGPCDIPQDIHIQCRCAQGLVLSSLPKPSEEPIAPPSEPDEPIAPEPVIEIPIPAAPIAVVVPPAPVGVLDDAAAALKAFTIDGQLVDSRSLGDSSNANASFRMVLEKTNGDKETVVFKPVSGENFGGGSNDSNSLNLVRDSISNRDFTLARREELAARIDKLIGTNMVPPTVFSAISGQEGMVQTFMAGFEPSTRVLDSATSDEARLKMGILDLIIGNTDRHGGNWMVKTATKEVIAIDHGYAFPSGTEDDYLGVRELRMKEWQQSKAGKTSVHVPYLPKINQEILAKMQSVQWEKLIKLYPEMNMAERDALRERIDWVIGLLKANGLQDVIEDIDYGYWVDIVK